MITTNKKFLTKHSDAVRTLDEAEKLEKALLSEFNAHDGKCQGLAASQIRINKAAILLRYKKGHKPIVVFNPQVLKVFGRWPKFEGCLSEPHKQYLVRRPIFAKVQYDDMNLNTHTKWLTYKKARIFEHEVDHVNGILLSTKNTLGVSI